MPDNLKTMTDAQYIMTAVGLAGATGWANYYSQLGEGKEFSWTEMLRHVGMSMFCGYVAFEFAAWEGCPGEIAGCISGCAGYLGTRLLRIFEIALRKRVGVTKEDLKDD